MGIGGFASSSVSVLNQGLSAVGQSSFEMYEIAKKKVNQIPVEQLKAKSKKVFTVAKDMIRGDGKEVKFSFSAHDVRHIPIANVVATLLETRSIHKQSQELSDELRTVYGTGDRVNANIAKLVGKAFLFYWFCLGKKRWFTRFIVTDLFTTACSWALSSPKTVGAKSDDALGGLYIPKQERAKIIDPSWSWTLTPKGRKVKISGQEAVFALPLSPRRSVDVPKTLNWDEKLDGNLTYCHLVGADPKLLGELHSKELEKKGKQSQVKLATETLFGTGNSRLSLDNSRLSLEELHSMLISAGLKEDWDRIIKELGEKATPKKKAAQDAAEGSDSEVKPEELVQPSHIKDLMTLLGYPDNDAAESIIDTVERFSTLAETATLASGVLDENTVGELVSYKQEIYHHLRQVPDWLLNLGLNTAEKTMHDLQQVVAGAAQGEFQTIHRMPSSLKEYKQKLLSILDAVDARITEDGVFRLQNFERELIDTRKSELLRLVEPTRRLLRQANPENLAARGIVLGVRATTGGVLAVTNVAQAALEDISKRELTPHVEESNVEVPGYFKELASRIRQITSRQPVNETDQVEITNDDGTTHAIQDEQRHKIARQLEHFLIVAGDLNNAVLTGDADTREDLLASFTRGVSKAAADGIRNTVRTARQTSRGLQERISSQRQADNRASQALLDAFQGVQRTREGTLSAMRQLTLEDSGGTPGEALVLQDASVGIAPRAQFEQIAQAFTNRSIQVIGGLVTRQMRNLQSQGEELVTRQQERVLEDVASVVRKTMAYAGQQIANQLSHMLPPGEAISSDETLAVQNPSVATGTGAQFEAIVQALENQMVEVAAEIISGVGNVLAERAGATAGVNSGGDLLALEDVGTASEENGNSLTRVAEGVVRLNLATIRRVAAQRMLSMLQAPGNGTIEERGPGFFELLVNTVRQNAVIIRNAINQRMSNTGLARRALLNEENEPGTNAAHMGSDVSVEDVTEQFLAQRRQNRDNNLIFEEDVERFCQQAEERPESLVGELINQVPQETVEAGLRTVAQAQGQLTAAIIGAQRVVRSIPNATFALIDRAREGEQEALSQLIEQGAQIFGLNESASSLLRGVVHEFLKIETGGLEAIEDGAPLLRGFLTEQAKNLDPEGRVQRTIQTLDEYRKQGLALTDQAGGLINGLDGNRVQELVNGRLTERYRENIRELKVALAKMREKVDQLSDQYLDSMTAAAQAFMPSTPRRAGRLSTAPIDFNPKEFKSTTVNLHRVQAQLIAEYKKSSDDRLLDLIGMLQRSFAKIRIGEELCVKVGESEYVAEFPEDWSYSQRKVYTDLFNKVSGLPKAKIKLKEPLSGFFARTAYEDTKKKQDAEKKRGGGK